MGEFVANDAWQGFRRFFGALCVCFGHSGFAFVVSFGSALVMTFVDIITAFGIVCRYSQCVLFFELL